MDQASFIHTSSKLLNQLCIDFEKLYQYEQALLLDLSREIYLESIRYFNLNDIDKAKTSIYALAIWLSKDVQYFFYEKS